MQDDKLNKSSQLYIKKRFFTSRVLTLVSFFLIVFLLAVSADSQTIDLRPAETHATDLRHQEVENIYHTLLTWINDAKKTIDIEMWNFWQAERGSMRVLHDALQSASDRGVKIRIALGVNHGFEDHVSTEYFGKENILVKIVEPAAHSKYMVVDDKKVTVGAANWSWTALHQNYEFNLNSEDSRLASAFTYLFESLWASSGGDITSRGEYWESDRVKPLARGRYVPEEFGLISDEQIKLIDSAKDKITISLYHYKPFYDDLYEQIHKRLIAAAERGVVLTFLIDKDSYKGIDKERIDHLASLDNTYIKIIDLAPAPPIEGAGASHSKIFLTDSLHGIVSSMNWDRFTFDQSGRDAGIYFKDPNLYRIIEESVNYSFYSPYASWAEGQMPLPDKKIFSPSVMCPRLTNISSTSANFLAGFVDDGGADYPAVYFVWQPLSDGGNYWSISSPPERIFSPQEITYQIEDLYPDTQYLVALQAINEAGRSRSQLINFKTLPQ